jgi:hypothetical protein
MYNIVNNYYKPGPATPKNESISFRILKPESGRSKLPYVVFGRAHVEGNIVEGNEAVTKDNWNGGIQVEGKKGGQLSLEESKPYFASMRVKKPMPMAAVTILPAQAAKAYVLENVGANLPVRDAVDFRIIKQVKTGNIDFFPNVVAPTTQFKHRRMPLDSYKTGIITDVNQVGGYPVYAGKPYKDFDNDGMPDAYETKHGLNPKNADDAKLISKTGYSNIEDYLNSLVDIKTVTPAGK